MVTKEGRFYTYFKMMAGKKVKQCTDPGWIQTKSCGDSLSDRWIYMNFFQRVPKELGAFQNVFFVIFGCSFLCVSEFYETGYVLLSQC